MKHKECIMYWNVERNRLKACYVDFLLIHFGSLILYFFIGILLNDDRCTAPAFYTAMWLCRDCFNGSSYGKHKYCYQVINIKTGTIASPVQCWIRNFFFVFFHLVDIIVMFSNPQNRRWGEMLTNTKVVGYKNIKKTHSMKQKIESFVIIISTFVLMYIVMVPLTEWLLALDGKFNF